MARHKAIDGVFEFEASAIDGDDGVYIERSFVGREGMFDGVTVPKELILDVADDIRSEEEKVKEAMATIKSVRDSDCSPEEFQCPDCGDVDPDVVLTHARDVLYESG